MNIVEFYKQLSKLLEDYREERTTYSKALLTLRDLLKEAQDSELDLNVSEDILNMNNLTIYDEERSYDSTSYEESSYEDDEENYQSSY